MSSDIQHAREHFRDGNLLLLRSRRLFLVLRLSGSLINYIVFAFITFWTRFFPSDDIFN